MIDFDKFSLENGLKVIVHRDTSTPIATVNLLYNVGSRDENPNQTGFAHLFEHLMFGGSVNIPSFDKPIQISGGENNAFTSADLTNYYITLPKENLEIAFWLESDRMLDLDFSETNLTTEKSIVSEEFKQRYLNQPYGDVWLLMRPMAYKSHPYMWPTIGKELSHIQNASLEDVKSFYYRFYGPNNAILVVAGNVDVRQVKTLAEKWFGDIEKRNTPPRCIPIEPPQTQARKLEVERNVPYNAIYKAYKMCNRLSDKYYATDMLSDILASGNSSRLYQQLVKKKKLFSSIDAFITGNIDEGLFVISGRLTDGVTYQNAEDAINEELTILKNKSIEEYELLKIKNKLEAMIIIEEISVLNKAINLAYYELLGDANMVNHQSEKYLSVSAGDIKAVANELFQKENCSTLYYKSKKQNNQ